VSLSAYSSDGDRVADAGSEEAPYFSLDIAELSSEAQPCPNLTIAMHM
jgi:hypothetical protein